MAKIVLKDSKEIKRIHELGSVLVDNAFKKNKIEKQNAAATSELKQILHRINSCERKTQWCNGEDVKLCQMKSKAKGVTGGGNVYQGRVLRMCKECRIAENGQFKLVTNERG